MIFENDTRLIEKIIAHDSMKVHFGQNLIVFISIFLTTVMLTGVITTGFSFYHAEAKYSDLSAGPGADGFAIMGGTQQEEKIKQYPEVEWAALVQDASYKRLENPLILNCDVELLVTDQIFYDNNYIVLQAGIFPEKEADILISNTLAKKLDLLNPVGKKVEFTITIHENGEEIKTTMDFHVCGLYENPLAGLAADYEEIYTSSEFINKHNPDILEKPGRIYVKLNGISDKKVIYKRLQKMNDEIGGAGVIAKMQEADNKETVIMVISSILIIMLAAYFIIFNVFSISLANDIRYYGMMKTIGATTRQIRATLNRQVYMLFPFSLIFGLLVGHGCGHFVAPKIVGLMDGLKNFYEPAPIIWPSCVVAIFVFLTVKVSCFQSFRKVSKISPIEAARFVVPKRMNVIFASLSLILSCMIFSSVFTFFFGYDVTGQVNKHNIYDFKLMNNLYLFGNGSESFEPISSKMCSELEALPFADHMEIVYVAHSQPDSYIDGMETCYYLRAKVKNTGLLAEDFKRAKSEKMTYDFDRTNGDLRIPLCGVSDETIKRTFENGNFKIEDGRIDLEKFESGKYVIYQPFGMSASNLVVHAGDNMEIQVFDDTKGNYITKNLKVMAVVTNNDPYGRSQFSQVGICLLDKTFKEIYPNYNQMIASVALDSNASSYLKEQQEAIENLMSKYAGYQITFSSRYDSTLYFEKERNTSFLIGLFFAIFFGIIGITNIINSIANSILSNRISYTRMQAVGMTQRQLVKELTMNNLKTYGLAALAFVPLEFLVLTRIFSGFSIKMFVISALLILLAVLAILILTSYILTKYLNRKNIAQRLREFE